MNAHGQDVPQVERRTGQFNFTDHSCVEILSLPVKSNLHSESNRMHMVRMYHKWKREQTTLISHRLFSCVGMLNMYEPGKSNLLAENR